MKIRPTFVALGTAALLMTATVATASAERVGSPNTLVAGTYQGPSQHFDEVSETRYESRGSLSGFRTNSP